ncbi:MAG: DUF131 domain-containing protein [Sulfolobaceae archaeon]
MMADLSILLPLGFVLIFIGIILTIIGIIKEYSTKGESERRTETKAGGIIFIGPIPIIFGSDKEIAKWMLIIALVILIILAILVLI